MKAHYLTTNSLHRSCQACITTQRNAAEHVRSNVAIQIDATRYSNFISNRIVAISTVTKTFPEPASTVLVVVS